MTVTILDAYQLKRRRRRKKVTVTPFGAITLFAFFHLLPPFFHPSPPKKVTVTVLERLPIETAKVRKGDSHRLGRLPIETAMVRKGDSHHFGALTKGNGVGVKKR